jgi:uncharacterized membrane-anchored protein
MSNNVVFEGMALVAAFFFLFLGMYLLVYFVSVWKERGMDAARWMIVSDVLAFALSILFWLFWFFC